MLERPLFKTLRKNIGWLLHPWNLIFDIACPYPRPNRAKNQDFFPSGLFSTCWNTQSSSLLHSLLPNTTGGREECSDMCHTYLEQVSSINNRIASLHLALEAFKAGSKVWDWWGRLIGCLVCQTPSARDAKRAFLASLYKILNIKRWRKSQSGGFFWHHLKKLELL